MDSIAKAINNHSIDKSIHQLHETTIRQQTAINAIPGTFAAQQKDIAAIKTAIVDIRISINHLIRSVSEISTKLGFQIALPSPLPLSPTPPTPLPTIVSGCTTPLPSLNSSNLPSTIISSTTASSSLTTCITIPMSTVLTSSTSSLQLGSGKPCDSLLFISSQQVPPRPSFIQSIDPCLHSTPFTSMSPSSFSWFTINIKQAFPETQGVAIIVDNNFHLAKLLSTIAYSQNLDESKPLIFDPGGKIDFECLFVLWLHGDAKLNHSPGSTTSITQPPTSDLEDKVVFEGSVMIRINDKSKPTYDIMGCQNACIGAATIF